MTDKLDRDGIERLQAENADLKALLREALDWHERERGIEPGDSPMTDRWYAGIWGIDAKTGGDNLNALLRKAMNAYNGMSPEEQAVHRIAQAASFARGMAPCEHGVFDWEDCPKCIDAATGAGKETE